MTQCFVSTGKLCLVLFDFWHSSVYISWWFVNTCVIIVIFDFLHSSLYASWRFVNTCFIFVIFCFLDSISSMLWCLGSIPYLYPISFDFKLYLFYTMMFYRILQLYLLNHFIDFLNSILSTLWCFVNTWLSCIVMFCLLNSVCLCYDVLSTHMLTYGHNAAFLCQCLNLL